MSEKIPQPETRKLAAVMFADIEGYTALFQRNETAAIKQVNDHRKDLEQITLKFNGKIIQFYGDGSATIYDSVIDAVKCAIQIQLVSAKHRIPVRIGIHMGDLIFKDGDIFGDVVNVASRIQSAGIPGSILVSKKVVDELNNHPDLHTKRIGFFSLKNVKDRVELFALTASGLAVPPAHVEEKQGWRKFTPYFLTSILLLSGISYWAFKQYQITASFKIGEERVCVPPFKNLTLNTDYDIISESAASLVTQALAELEKANVVNYESLIRYFNSDLTPLINNPLLARSTGADYSIQGYYALKGQNQDTLYFWASVLDLRTKKTLSLTIPKVYCSATNYMQCAEEMANNLKGYWDSKDEHTFRIPNGDAWEAYVAAQKSWADPKSEAQTKAYLIKAIQSDSNFIDAYFLLMDELNNRNSPEGYKNQADTIELMKKRFPNMKNRERNYLTFYEEDLKGKNIEAFKYFMKEYENDPEDLFINTDGVLFAMEYLNDPETALRLFRKIDYTKLDLNTCVYCRTRVGLALQAYTDISDSKNAGALAEFLRPFAVKKAQVTRLIAYYLHAGDTMTVNTLISKIPKVDTTKNIIAYYYRIAAEYSLLNNNLPLCKFYAGRALQLYGNIPNWNVTRCHYLIGNLTLAEKQYIDLLGKRPDDPWFNGDLGVIYAKQKNTIKANAIIAKLDGLKKAYDYGLTPYLQARIKANLGEETAALQYLHAALDEGIKFWVASTFQHDPDLMILNSNADYQKLLIKNRQHLEGNKK